MNGLRDLGICKDEHKTLKSSHRHVIFDLETTGLSPQRGDRVVEIGAIAVENGSAAQEFHSLINIGKKIPLQAQAIHGINNEMIRKEKKAEEVFPDFLSFIKDSVLVAHNASFDCRFLRYELGRLGLPFDNKHICTLKLSRKLYPKLANHRLETVYRHLVGNLPSEANLHRALDDARLVADIWMEMTK